MTTWHDQASDLDVQAARPGTRRAAREAERRAAEFVSQGREHPSGVVDFEAGPFTEQDAERLGAHDTNDIWEALSRRAVEPSGDEDRPMDGRRARRSAMRADAPAPSRPAVRADAQPDSGGAEPGAVSPMNAELLDRVRSVVRERHPEEAPAPRPLTRRELRERAEAEAPQSAVQQAPAAFVAPRQEPTAYQPQQAPTAYQPEQPAARPFGSPRAPQPRQAEPFVPEQVQQIPAAFAGYVDAPTVAMSAIDQPSIRPAEAPMLHHLQPEPAGDDDLSFSDVEDAFTPQPTVRIQAQQVAVDPTFLEPPVDTDVTDLRGFEAMINRARSAQAPAPMPNPVAETPSPALSWDDEDVQAPGDDLLLSRNVGSSHGAANALIMPTDPQPADLTQAVSGTGELFITGSMQLPRELAQTGATAEHYDSIEMDRLFEAAQDEPAAGVAPVRASRAVSGSDRSRIAPRRGRGGAAPMILAAIAGAMALGVVGLLVGSWVFNLF